MIPHKEMTFLFDLDDTLVTTKDRDYMSAVPIPGRIEHVNSLYDAGHFIKIETARGVVSGKDWYQKTFDQLVGFGLKFNTLRVGVKQHYDIQVCDKSINTDAYFRMVHLYDNPDQRAIDLARGEL
jgi:hypothetical protein